MFYNSTKFSRDVVPTTVGTTPLLNFFSNLFQDSCQRSWCQIYWLDRPFCNFMHIFTQKICLNWDATLLRFYMHTFNIFTRISIWCGWLFFNFNSRCNNLADLFVFNEKILVMDLKFCWFYARIKIKLYIVYRKCRCKLENVDNWWQVDD